MRLSKIQQEVYDQLLRMIEQRGRAYVFGWALGQLIRLSEQDVNLRLRIKQKIQ